MVWVRTDSHSDDIEQRRCYSYGQRAEKLVHHFVVLHDHLTTVCFCSTKMVLLRQQPVLSGSIMLLDINNDLVVSFVNSLSNKKLLRDPSSRSRESPSCPRRHRPKVTLRWLRQNFWYLPPTYEMCNMSNQYGKAHELGVHFAIKISKNGHGLYFVW